MFARMLNKVKIPMIVGIVLSALRLLFPNVEQPDGLQESLILVIDWIWGFFTVGAMTAAGYRVRESRAKMRKLRALP